MFCKEYTGVWNLANFILEKNIKISLKSWSDLAFCEFCSAFKGGTGMMGSVMEDVIVVQVLTERDSVEKDFSSRREDNGMPTGRIKMLLVWFTIVRYAFSSWILGYWPQFLNDVVLTFLGLVFSGMLGTVSSHRDYGIRKQIAVYVAFIFNVYHESVLASLLTGSLKATLTFVSFGRWIFDLNGLC